MFFRWGSAGRANKWRQATSIRPKTDLRLKNGKRLTILAAVCLCSILGSSWAQGPATKTAKVVPQNSKEVASPASTPALTEPDLRAFVDGIVPLQLERGNIAGAIVLVVKDGKVLFSKGYG